MAQTQIKPDYIHQQMASIVQAIQAGMEKKALISYVQHVEKEMIDKVEEPAFNYDLARMKAHVESDSVTLPSHITKAQDIKGWLLNE